MIQDATLNEWHIPCPRCQKFFYFSLRQIACPNCGAEIEKHEAAGLNRKGKWVAIGKAPKGTIAFVIPHKLT